MFGNWGWVGGEAGAGTSTAIPMLEDPWTEPGRVGIWGPYMPQHGPSS